jgi:MFS transporter, DHA1 family, multidrug resistance protein
MTSARAGDDDRRTLRPTVLTLYLLAALGPFTVDLYLPALPQIQHRLDASTVAAQLTLTATTLGFAAGQLVIGNWTDAVGRRRPLLLATALHVAASIGVALSPSIGWVLVFRLLQGAGAAGSGVVASAMVRDLFAGARFVQMLARIALISGLAPVVAPMLGSQLLQVTDWRGLFVIVAGYGTIVLALALARVAETLPPERRLDAQPRAVLQRYRTLLADRAFVGIGLIGGFMVSGVFAMMTSSSFLLQSTFGLDARGYSLVSACNAIAFVVGTQVAARVVRRVPPARPLIVALPVMALAGFAIAPASAGGVVSMTAATVVFMVGAGSLAPCLQVIGLGRNGHQAGTASALLGATNFGMAGLASPVVGAIGVDSAVPMALMMGGTQVISTALLWWLVRPMHLRLAEPGQLG